MNEKTVLIRLPGRLKKGPEKERRAWVRVQSGQEICCQPLGALTAQESETGWPGIVRDISPGGMALILTRRFEPGTILIVELETKAEESRRVLARVVHATLETNGRWIIGCTFADLLCQADLQAFSSKL